MWRTIRTKASFEHVYTKLDCRHPFYYNHAMEALAGYARVFFCKNILSTPAGVATTAEWSKGLDSGSREPGSIPVLALLVGFSALPTRKSTLTGNEHSRPCGCPYTQKRAAALGVMCKRVKREEKKRETPNTQ